MKSFRHFWPLLFMGSLLSLAVVPIASACHEAMFGPQSSSVLSPGMFISAQVFDRENGQNGFKHRETTTVFSAGFRPIKSSPLSLAFVAPITHESFTEEPSTTRFEDHLISARYRVNANGVARALHVQESYVMGVGGVEVPLGNKDHEAGHGPSSSVFLTSEHSPLRNKACRYPIAARTAPSSILGLSFPRIHECSFLPSFRYR